MALRELVGGLTDSSSVKRVFGEPIERDGILIIPVARIRGAFGGGEAASAAGNASEAGGAAAPAALPVSWGGGGAWSATPAGTYVLKNGEMSWVPATDANRVILLGCLTGIVALLVIRSVVRTIVKRG
jgi:uncharacterized spore protein YtfJ